MNIDMHVNSNAERAVTGCFGWAEKDIRGVVWTVAFYTTGEQVRLFRGGKEIEWHKANAAARKFAHSAAETLKGLLRGPALVS
jgi:hypothetical protein